MALESKIEGDTRKALKKLGALFIKLNPMKYAGIPDRVIIGQFGTIIFVELKRPGKEARKIQKHWHVILRGLGFTTMVSTSVEETVDAYKEEMSYNGAVMEYKEALKKKCSYNGMCLEQRKSNKDKR